MPHVEQRLLVHRFVFERGVEALARVCTPDPILKNSADSSARTMASSARALKELSTSSRDGQVGARAASRHRGFRRYPDRYPARTASPAAHRLVGVAKAAPQEREDAEGLQVKPPYKGNAVGLRSAIGRE